MQHTESSVGGNSTAECACIRDIVENFITYVTEELVVTSDHHTGCPWILKKGQSIKKNIRDGTNLIHNVADLYSIL